ncbi:PGPGW domain-containing protein [Intrasporangium sp. DVR]
MLKALLIVGLAISVVGVLMIRSPGPGFLLLAFGIGILSGSGIALRQQRR